MNLTPATEVRASLPTVDHLLYLEVTPGVPAGWVQHEKHGLSFALPPEYAPGARKFDPDDPRVAAFELPHGLTMGVPASVTVVWEEGEHLVSGLAEPGTRQLDLDGAALATTVWAENGVGDPGEADTSIGHAIVARADGGGHYSIDWVLPGGSDGLIEQFLGSLVVLP